MNDAIALFYPGVKERIAELFGGGFCVAFTSIHERRFHKKGTISPRLIPDQIKHMNKTFNPTEILSRKVYLYEAGTKVFQQLELSGHAKLCMTGDMAAGLKSLKETGGRYDQSYCMERKSA